MGARRRRRPALHPAGATGDGEVTRREANESAPLSARRALRGARERPRHRPEDRAGRGAPDRVRKRDGPREGRRRAGHRHDRSRLGAGDEARRARSSPTAADAPATRRSSRANSAFRRSSVAATRPRCSRKRRQVTVSCADGDTGHVYEGLLAIDIVDVALDKMPPAPTKIMMNVGNPELAFEFQRAAQRRRRPGAARIHHQPQRGRASQGVDRTTTRSPPSSSETSRSASAAMQARPSSTSPRSARAWRRSRPRSGRRKSSCVFRTSSPTNTPTCSAARASSRTRKIRCWVFAVRRAISRPSSTTVSSSNARRSSACATTWASPTSRSWCRSCARWAKRSEVVDLLANNGLARGDNGLRLIMMCEIPSNAVLADRFLEHFDGFSIGSNDMTQLTLAVDRDAGGAICGDLRRARRRGEGDAVDGDHRVPQGRQVRRHLRAGTV